MLRFALFFVLVVVTVQLLVAFVSVWIGRFLHPDWESNHKGAEAQRRIHGN